MEKTKPENHYVEMSALTRYVYSLFSEMMVPPLHSFLNLTDQINQNIKVPTFTLDPNGLQDPALVEALEGEAIVFLQSGAIELQKKIR